MVFLVSYLLSALACAALHPVVGTTSAKRIDRGHIQALQREAADRFNRVSRLAAVPSGGGGGAKNFTFSNPAASGELCHHTSLSRELEEAVS
jgi:enhancing lycopene biosynthesis protein 2